MVWYDVFISYGNFHRWKYIFSAHFKSTEFLMFNFVSFPKTHFNTKRLCLPFIKLSHLFDNVYSSTQNKNAKQQEVIFYGYIIHLMFSKAVKLNNVIFFEFKYIIDERRTIGYLDSIYYSIAFVIWVLWIIWKSQKYTLHS